MSGTALKFLMMFLMVLDHIHYFVPHKAWLVFHVLSRCVAPFFAYMTVEGFIHTRSRPTYIKRLFFWAAAMLAGNSVLNYIVIQNADYQIKNSIILTFAISMLILYLSENKNDIKRVPKGLLAVFRVLLIIYVLCASDIFGIFIPMISANLSADTFAHFVPEGGLLIFPLIAVTYYYREKRTKRNLFYLAFSLLFLFLQLAALDFSLGITESILRLAEGGTFLFITFLPFVYLYNGKRGWNSKFSKYIFYAFYPAHIWIITITAWLLYK